MASIVVAAMMLAAAALAWGGLGWVVATVPSTRPVAVLAAYVFAFASRAAFGPAFVPVLAGVAWTLASISGLGVLWVAARRSIPEAPRIPAMPLPPAVR